MVGIVGIRAVVAAPARAFPVVERPAAFAKPAQHTNAATPATPDNNNFDVFCIKHSPLFLTYYIIKKAIKKLFLHIFVIFI